MRTVAETGWKARFEMMQPEVSLMRRAELLASEKFSRHEHNRRR